MGLIQAGLGAAGGILADQWKEFFYCDSLANDVMMVKGQKRTGSRSSNTKASDNIISNGSVITVADGQCMIIVEQGKIVEVCAETGEFVYDKSTEPSIFAGSLGNGIKETFKAIGRRFTFGGDTGKDQRVYYFNTKELLDNKFGTANPIPFRIVDSKIGFDLDVSLRCSGTYTYRIIDPLLFYTNVCGNVTDEYPRSAIEGQLKTEFIAALQPAVGRLSELEIRPNQIVTHNRELEAYVNEELSRTWGETRGLKVQTISIGTITLPEEDAEALKQAQQSVFYSDPSKAGGMMAKATASAMNTAAGNTAGAMAGFMGMGMAGNAGGSMASNLFAMGQQNQQAAPPQTAPQQPAGGWKCSCGATATGNFCPECGAKKPAEEGWQCSCGSVNKGKFCPQCGAKKPEGAPLYRCDKCGWEPEDPRHPPKFCPECGDIFDDNDKK